MHKVLCPKFDIRYDGVRHWLGPTETEVMECIWDMGEYVTVKRVHSHFRHKAYTTISTTMVRLSDHGLLVRVRKSSLAWVYRASMTRKEFMEIHVREVMHSVIAANKELS